jgi:hypothetical protein
MLSDYELATHTPIVWVGPKNNKIIYLVTYHDILPSILAFSVDRWTGFGKMPSS